MLINVFNHGNDVSAIDEHGKVIAGSRRSFVMARFNVFTVGFGVVIPEDLKYERPTLPSNNYR